MMQSFVPPVPLGTWKVFVQQVPRQDARDWCELEIASGLTRRDAAELAGLLLLCPLYHVVRLQEDCMPGRWVAEAGQTEG